MATAPNLVVAGDPDVGAALRNTGAFRAVYDVASASELNAISQQRVIVGTTSFLFTPRYVSDVPGVDLKMLTGHLTRHGHRVLVHVNTPDAAEASRDNPAIKIISPPFNLSRLLSDLGAPEPTPAPRQQPHGPVAAPARRTPTHTWSPQPPAPPSAAPPNAVGPHGPPPPPGPRQAASPHPPDPRQPFSPGPAAPPVHLPNGRSGQAYPRTDTTGDIGQVPSRVIVIAAPKGGVGKSSLSVSLALFAARELHPRGARVALVDTNFQQSDVGKYLGQYGPNVLDLIRSPGGLTRERIGTFLLQPPGTDLSVLLGPSSAADADPAVINTTLYRKILHVLREIYGVILVDTPVAEFYHELFSQLVLPKADYILVPVEPNRVTLEDTKGWLTAITAPRHTGGGGIDRNKIALVLNRARAGVNCDPEDVQDIMSGWRFAGMIPENDEWQAAINRGQLGDPQKLRDLDTVFRHILALATNQPGLFQDDVAPPHRKGGLRQKFGLKW